MGDTRLRRPKVFVIDDDESIRALLRLHLTNGGYDVLLAKDAIVGGISPSQVRLISSSWTFSCHTWAATSWQQH